MDSRQQKRTVIRPYRQHDLSQFSMWHYVEELSCWWRAVLVASDQELARINNLSAEDALVRDPST